MFSPDYSSPILQFYLPIQQGRIATEQHVNRKLTFVLFPCDLPSLSTHAAVHHDCSCSRQQTQIIHVQSRYK